MACALSPTVVVFEAHDIVFTQITAALHFDQDQIDLARVL
jgi:hypothetical protein